MPLDHILYTHTNTQANEKKIDIHNNSRIVVFVLMLLNRYWRARFPEMSNSDDKNVEYAG